MSKKTIKKIIFVYDDEAKNNALKTVYSPLSFEQAVVNPKEWGYIFESAIGAYLVNQGFIHRFEVYYWRERNDEVDFILQKKDSLVAIEVKSNAEKRTNGLDKFKEIFTKTKYKTINGCESDYDLIVGETIPITPICNEKELLKGKITKKRLVEIYSNLNQEMLEKKLQEYSELQEKNKIKELMKKYDN